MFFRGQYIIRTTLQIAYPMITLLSRSKESDSFPVSLIFRLGVLFLQIPMRINGAATPTHGPNLKLEAVCCAYLTARRRRCKVSTHTRVARRAANTVRYLTRYHPWVLRVSALTGESAHALPPPPQLAPCAVAVLIAVKTGACCSKKAVALPATKS